MQNIMHSNNRRYLLSVLNYISVRSNKNIIAVHAMVIIIFFVRTRFIIFIRMLVKYVVSVRHKPEVITCTPYYSINI